MTFATLKWGGRYMLAMVIGAYSSSLLPSIKSSSFHSGQRLAFSVGLGLRYGLHAHPESKGIYIAEYLFIVLSVGCHIISLAILTNMHNNSHVHSSPLTTYFWAVSLVMLDQASIFGSNRESSLRPLYCRTLLPS